MATGRVKAKVRATAEATLLESVMGKEKAKSTVKAMAKARVTAKAMDRLREGPSAAPADSGASAGSREHWAARLVAAVVDSSPHQDLERFPLELLLPGSHLAEIVPPQKQSASHAPSQRELRKLEAKSSKAIRQRVFAAFEQSGIGRTWRNLYVVKGSTRTRRRCLRHLASFTLSAVFHRTWGLDSCMRKWRESQHSSFRLVTARDAIPDGVKLSRFFRFNTLWC
jgi:hypothetical protein